MWPNDTRTAPAYTPGHSEAALITALLVLL